ncbi:hypothetical protein BGX27_000147 [Mortierella sp. AM989]|nr:hypothetical protein BGX27_000147 [Mortierella sp. AM989]
MDRSQYYCYHQIDPDQRQHDRFDTFMPSSFNNDGDTTNDTQWLSTYSRALCSLYPKDEDILLNLQSSTAFEKLAEAPSSFAVPSLQSNRQMHTYQRKSRSHRSASNRPTATLHEVTLTKDNTEENADEVVEQLRLAPPSPGSRLSQILCNIGFNMIDYFMSLDDEQESSSAPRINQTEEADTTTQEDQSDYWAAAVYSKRTAALERRRTLSRTSSQEDGVSDPWIEVLERLGQWGETA